MNDIQVAERRNLFIAKANEVIQKARNDLSVKELKLIGYIMTHIKPTDLVGTEYTIAISEYLKVCGISPNGQTYDVVRKNMKELADRSFWMRAENGNEVLVRWLSRVVVKPNSGTMTVKFDDVLMSYLVGLVERGRYTQFNFISELPMTRKYSITLFELLRSYVNLSNNYEFYVEDLKKLLGADAYIGKGFREFRRQVLDPAIEEINNFSEINAGYLLKTKGRKVVSIVFGMEKKNEDEWFEARWNNQLMLDGIRPAQQLDLFEDEE